MGMNDKKTILLDSDMIAFKIASRNEFVIDFENEQILGLYKYDENNENHIIHNTLEVAYDEIDEWLKEIQEDTCMNICNCLSSKNNFRRDFFPEYKSNRTQRRPSILGKIREYIKDNYAFIEHNRYEADDLLGIYGNKQENIIISSGDKDMKQINCTQYNWDTKEFYYVPEDEAIRFYYKQILIGDPVDGYKGLIGVGDKKAEKILITSEEHYINYCNKIEDNKQPKRSLESFYLEHIINEYKKKEMSMEYLNIQMVMAKILTQYDIDLNILETKSSMLKVQL